MIAVRCLSASATRVAYTSSASARRAVAAAIRRSDSLSAVDRMRAAWSAAASRAWLAAFSASTRVRAASALAASMI